MLGRKLLKPTFVLKLIQSDSVTTCYIWSCCWINIIDLSSIVLKLLILQLGFQINRATVVCLLVSSAIWTIQVTTRVFCLFLNHILYQTTGIQEIVQTTPQKEPHRQEFKDLEKIMNKTLKNKFLWHCAEKLKQEMFVRSRLFRQGWTTAFCQVFFWYSSLPIVLQCSLQKCKEVSS